MIRPNADIVSRYAAKLLLLLGMVGLLAIGLSPFPALTLASPEEPQPNAKKEVKPLAVNPVTIGPGRVRMTLTPTGTWLGLQPKGADNLINRGGFLVLADDVDGRAGVIASSWNGQTKSLGVTPGVAIVHEGVPGGARFPLPNPDDDGDGRVNEDRLDGVDNDEDGRIDEDFAAAGDEMIAVGYSAHTKAGRQLLEIHQECYAWTLPHIDGMVAIKLQIKNVSDHALNNIRIGSVIQTPAEFGISSQDLHTAEERNGRRLMAKGLLLTRPRATSLALLFFSERTVGQEDGNWLSGTTSEPERLNTLLEAALTAGADEDDAGGEAGRSERRAEKSVPPYSGDIDAVDGRLVYAVSPALGSLEAGATAEIYVALVAVPAADRIDRAMEDAYKTIVGDGTHRLIPPPVSITRRVVWGTYTVGDPQSDSFALQITLQSLREQGIRPGDILFLKGLDLDDAYEHPTYTGDVTFEFTGAVPATFAEAAGRKRLYGRLRSGEQFDVELKPTARNLGAGNSAEAYWSRPGKLDEALLTGSPNPFRESTTIIYEVPGQVIDDDGVTISFDGAVDASVKVYNVAGRLVSALVEGAHASGTYSVHWSALNDAGGALASGVYYVKLQIGNQFITKRLIQLK